jgi:hypothetical protein
MAGLTRVLTPDFEMKIELGHVWSEWA